MIQTSTLDKDLNDSKYVNIKCNFPFDMYVFRSLEDTNITLPWLSDFQSTQIYMQFKGAKNSEGDLRAVSKRFSKPDSIFKLGGNSDTYPPGK